MPWKIKGSLPGKRGGSSLHQEGRGWAACSQRDDGQWRLFRDSTWAVMHLEGVP